MNKNSFAIIEEKGESNCPSSMDSKQESNQNFFSFNNKNYNNLPNSNQQV